MSRSASRTYHRHGHIAIAWTVADGYCGRLRTVANVNATSSEHTLSPQTPRVKREPLLHIREKEKDTSITCLKTITSLHTFALNNMIRVRASCACALERHIHHMSENNHISTQICLQQHDSSACVCSVIK